MCICSICSNGYIKYFMDYALKTLNKYCWLVDAYILDFFVHQHWASLPSAWQEILLQLPPEDLGYWLDINKTYRYKKVWPLSLLALKATASLLTIPRQEEHVCPEEEFLKSKSSHCRHCKFIDFKAIPEEQDHANIFSKHIKPKKYHEINRIARVASSCAEKLGCQFIVDVGSGLGHLGRLLALRYGLRVCCLEEQTCLTEKARKLDEQLVKILSRKQDVTPLPPVHINMSIEAAVQCDKFLKMVYDAFDVPVESILKFGIVGLHPCGDLGPTLMRLLVNCPGACFINLVGCCYMKLSDDSASAVRGYPLSDHTMSSLNYHLSYESREVACHALETYTQRLRAGHISELKVHCYRAVLETIIIKNWPELKHSGLRSIKHVQDMNFSDYAAFAVERLGLKLPQVDLECSQTVQQLNQWQRVVIFYSLRLLLAPCVESTLLLDRMLFLQEKGISNFLLPAFDPELSPRNHILIAMKE